MRSGSGRCTDCNGNGYSSPTPSAPGFVSNLFGAPLRPGNATYQAKDTPRILIANGPAGPHGITPKVIGQNAVPPGYNAGQIQLWLQELFSTGRTGGQGTYVPPRPNPFTPGGSGEVFGVNGGNPPPDMNVAQLANAAGQLSTLFSNPTDCPSGDC